MDEDGQQTGFGNQPSAFSPEPERRGRTHVIISVDDHLVETPSIFELRVPTKLRERAPRVVETPDGAQQWVYDGAVLASAGIGLNAFAGRPIRERVIDPTRFEHMRRGAWDIDARIADMDLDGVYASVTFPSSLAGFGGIRLQTGTSDRDLALATVRAWNDWHIEAWAGPYPTRIIPCQIPWLHDPDLGADEVRRNAARGFKAVSFPDAPQASGMPSIFTTHWDPILAACAETETVVNLHVGSGGGTRALSAPDAPRDIQNLMFGLYGMETTIDWLYSLVAVRFPNLRICISEGGIGWVPGLLDRLAHMDRYSEILETMRGLTPSPVEVLQRNFWFCALDDPTAIAVRNRIGIDNILFEVDYPHGETNWPDSQRALSSMLADVPDSDAQRIAWRNASALYRHPVPQSVLDDPESF